MPRRTFVYGATILLGANLLNRLLGFAYQYLIMAHIGGEAYGLFTMVFPLYMLALVFTTAGIPLAIAKMVAEEVSLGRAYQARSIFRLAFWLLTVSGGFVSTSLYFLTPYIAHRIFPDPRVLTIFQICTPAIFIVSISSVFRGYFQGLQNMVPTAVSQICEQVIRVTVGYTTAVQLLKVGVEWAAAGLAIGMLAGEAVGLFVIIIHYQRSKIILTENSGPHPSSRHILSQLWHLASPVTVGRLFSTGLSALDAMLIPQCLLTAGYSAREATTLFGQLGGSAFTLLTFPSVFTFALATSLVPSISEAAAQRQFHILRARSSEAIRLTIMIGIPCLVILFYFSQPLTMFFKSPEISPVLRILALGGIFSYIQQTTTGILQGLGKVQLPVLHSIIAAVLRIPILIYLTSLPQWGLRGTAWAYVIGFIIMAALNLQAITRSSGMPIDLQRFLLQPFSGGIGMLLFFHTLDPKLGGHFIGYSFEFCCGLLLYALILVFNGGITFSDLRRLPWLGKYLKP
ncbi:membrane protein involved in the export of O-antigen and teichoic acid [Desulfosporosinus acidiphilus SJ4]|uniref:Membrane protein involved in the export of O-antigen and teichoic acid n=1 Tax=Desulfosporosinus acidiphilus (strain DSM 22704 / JCM 16185 / SJ4) TaxID=646529 RepID=I4D845_DESAJ|nr:polysaccharide biosynthesis protein [Desulfosporosinus acidiphilus]AFM41969.1 membrane protein involved in the export of O-antigen and teichoic acid [Desulfosporosinus acidiphilus SJ4]